MRRLLLAAAAILALGLPAGASPSSKATYYVSLGDSLAQGFQPTGGPLKSGNAPPGYNQGYTDQLFKLTRDRYPQLQEVKLGCGGATTTTLRFGGGFCSYVEGSQLAAAVAFLQEHAGEIAFVTIDIGGNDFIGGTDPAEIAQNLTAILAALKGAAGPGVPIVGMNYYNPFIAPVWFETQSLAAVQAEVANVVALNDFLEGIYQFAGVPVADVEGAFSLTDLTLVDGIPLNVLRECQWTWACAGPPVGFDIHANTDGYAVIAQAFADILP
jgi:lysophospholipase L1-like esterase